MCKCNVTDKDVRDLLAIVSELASMVSYESFCKRDNYKNHQRLQRLQKKFAKKVVNENEKTNHHGWPTK